MRRKAVAKTSIGAFGFILLWSASPTPMSAAGTDQELGEVKVERKPKFISNGRGQKSFDVTRHTVPLAEIHRSVPKDAIPALLYPTFIKASEVGKLLDVKDRVLGVSFNRVAKAYPFRILNWHELVNDEVAGQPVLVSW